MTARNQERLSAAWKDELNRLPIRLRWTTEEFIGLSRKYGVVQGQGRTLRLVEQKSEVYCVPAVAEMILEYDGISFRDSAGVVLGDFEAQKKIGAEMKTDVNGTSLANEVPAYNVLSKGKWKASTAAVVDFKSAKAQLDQFGPFKNGVEGAMLHARAAADYRTSNGYDELYIFDPYAQSAPDCYWEKWGVFHRLSSTCCG